MFKPTLVSIVALGGRDDRALLGLAAGAARGLEPSLGTAIVESASERDVEITTANVIHDSGHTGVVASIDGRVVVVGKAALLIDLGISTSRLGACAERLRGRGQHVLFVAVDGEIAGVLGVIDGDGRGARTDA